MTRFSAFLLFLCLLAVKSSAQQWQKNYQTSLVPDSNQIREFTKMTVCSDGHIAVAGQSDNTTEANISLTKIHVQNGSIIWQKVLKRPGVDAVNQLITTSDKGFALAGWISGITPSDVDGIVIKCDSLGEFQWAKRIGDDDDDEAFGLTQLGDGNILVVGASYSGLNRNGFAVKLNSDGEQIWTKKYKQGNFNAFRSAHALSGEPGSAVLAGYSWTLGPGSTLFDPFFLKIDADGNILWAKRKKQAGSQVLYDIEQSEDGGFIYAGVTSTSSDNQALIGKINATGDHVWAKATGTPLGDRIWDIGILPSGEIAAVGFTDKPGSVLNRRNAFFGRFSSTGQWIDGQLVGSSDTSSVSFTGSVVATDAFLANALTYQNGFTYGAGLIARIPFSTLAICNTESLTMNVSNISTSDSSGAQVLAGPSLFDTDIDEVAAGDLNVFDVCLVNSVGSGFQRNRMELVQIYPNPGFEFFNLESQEKMVSIRVFAANGSLVDFCEGEIGHFYKLNLVHQTAGIYKLLVNTTKGLFSTTLVKE